MSEKELAVITWHMSDVPAEMYELGRTPLNRNDFSVKNYRYS